MSVTASKSSQISKSDMCIVDSPFTRVGHDGILIVRLDGSNVVGKKFCRISAAFKWNRFVMHNLLPPEYCSRMKNSK